MIADLRIFTYLPNPRLYKATITARYSGAEIDIRGEAPTALLDWLWDYDARAITPDEKEAMADWAREAKVGFKGHKLYKSDAFLLAHPFGNVPAAFANEGAVGIFESNAIMRAAARLGDKEHNLFGRDPMEESRVDSFLDRALVFARDAQRYLLAPGGITEALYEEMAESFHSFVGGLDRVLESSSHLASDQLSLADIAAVCEFCLFTNESRHTDTLASLGVEPLCDGLAEYTHLYAYLTRLAGNENFNADLESYFATLLATRE